MDRGDMRSPSSDRAFDCGDIDSVLVAGNSRPFSCRASSAAEGCGALSLPILTIGGDADADMSLSGLLAPAALCTSCVLLDMFATL